MAYPATATAAATRAHTSTHPLSPHLPLHSCSPQAFNAWFAIAPLMPVIKNSLGLTKDQVQMSNLAAVASTVFTRILIGPLCDRYGPKVTMAGLLALGAIPVFLIGVVNNWQGLVALRFFIGILGATFVQSQAWTTNMFKKRCIGAANAIVGGWGNLGGGSTQVIMVAIFAGIQSWGVDPEKAWRISFIFPGIALVLTAAIVQYFGQDTPRVGNGKKGGKR